MTEEEGRKGAAERRRAKAEARKAVCFFGLEWDEGRKEGGSGC